MIRIGFQTLPLLRSSFVVLVAFRLCAQDSLIIPGERVGPVVRNSSKESLAKQVGSANIAEGFGDGGEGETYPVTVLFRNDPTRALAVQFGKDGHPIRVDICPDVKQGCKWRTTEGLTVGTTLRQLAKMNQAEISFYGFGWDYDGVVQSWNGGALNKLKGCAGLYVRLRADADRALAKSISGDHPISSSNRALRNLDVRVWRLALTFATPECSN